MCKNRRYTVYVSWRVYRLLYFVQSKTIFDSLFGYFHLCWVRSDRHCFRRFTHKKRNSKKKSDCFSLILSYKGYNLNHPHTVHDPQEVFRWSPVQIASEAHFSWSVTFLHWSKNGNFFSKAMLVRKPALRLCFLPFFKRNVLSFGGFFKVRMGERSVRIREVKGSNPSRSIKNKTSCRISAGRFSLVFRFNALS